MKLFQLLILALLFFSCNQGNNDALETLSNNENVSADVLENEDDSTTVLIENDSISSESLVTDSVHQEFEFAGDFPTKVNIKIQYFDNTQFPYQDSVNEIVRRNVQTMTISDSINHTIINKELLKLCSNHFIEEFKAYANESEYTPSPWETELRIAVLERKNYVQIDDVSFVYAGGAHGNGRQDFYNISKETGKILTLEDFFTDIDELTKIGEEYFRTTHKENYPNITDWNDSFWFESGQFELLNNFSIGEKTIYFAINQYDIAAYAAGTFDFEIPREKVEHLLREQFKN